MGSRMGPMAALLFKGRRIMRLALSGGSDVGRGHRGVSNMSR